MSLFFTARNPIPYTVGIRITSRKRNRMPTLANFTQFDGRYWDTASIRNALDYQGTKAPHTGQPYTEAMLLGISGGIAFGYFTFHYRGYDPQVNLLTRNTFEPMETIFNRMGIPRQVLQTTSADKGRQKLIRALEDGYAPIVKPDMWLLPYNALPYDKGMWGGMPAVVYGYEPQKGEACLSDRSMVSLTVAADELDRARARIKKDRHFLLLLEPPDESRLAAAIRQGIADCLRLMTEKPPRGSVKNFGLRAFQHWREMLQKQTKGSWAREYPTGRPLLAVLMSSYTFLGPAFGKTMQAERDVYADFLEEAAQVLQISALDNAAIRYRIAGEAWQNLLRALLPDDVPMLKQARETIDRKARLFIESGAAALPEMLDCSHRLDRLKQAAEADFPMTAADISDLRGEIARHIENVHQAEAEAARALKAAI